MNKPAVSVIIPVFNREKLVLDTLESLKLQSFDNWECIIVDDYSTDNTIQEIEKFIANDARFKLIQKKTEPKGAPSSRNIGWRNAESEYIVFLDSDDLLAPWALENRVAFVKENETLDFALFTNIEFVKGRNETLKIRASYKIENALHSFLSFETTWQTTSPIWKKAFLEKINGWDEEALSWQDGEIHIRALIENPTFLWSDSSFPDYFIRIDGTDKITSKTNFGDASKHKNVIHIYSKIYELLPKNLANLFKDNVQTTIYNRIEILDLNTALQLINAPFLRIFGLSHQKLHFYIKLFHSTKSIPVLRKFVYLIREKTNLFSRRKKFFQKSTLDKKNMALLKTKLAPYDLYARNFII